MKQTNLPLHTDTSFDHRLIEVSCRSGAEVDLYVVVDATCVVQRQASFTFEVSGTQVECISHTRKHGCVLQSGDHCDTTSIGFDVLFILTNRTAVLVDLSLQTCVCSVDIVFQLQPFRRSRTDRSRLGCPDLGERQ